MKPVMQDKFGKGGNCLSACIASLLEIPLSEVPNFHDERFKDVPEDHPEGSQAFWANVHKFLNSKGYSLIIFQNQLFKDILPLMAGYFLVGGESPRGYQHSVIYTKEGLAHDPHPEGGGVIPESMTLIYPMFKGEENNDE